jgi:hypothetical protein
MWPLMYINTAATIYLNVVCLWATGLGITIHGMLCMVRRCPLYMGIYVEYILSTYVLLAFSLFCRESCILSTIHYSILVLLPSLYTTNWDITTSYCPELIACYRYIRDPENILDAISTYTSNGVYTKTSYVQTWTIIAKSLLSTSVCTITIEPNQQHAYVAHRICESLDNSLERLREWADAVCMVKIVMRCISLYTKTGQTVYNMLDGRFVLQYTSGDPVAVSRQTILDNFRDIASSGRCDPALRWYTNILYQNLRTAILTAEAHVATTPYDRISIQHHMYVQGAMTKYHECAYPYSVNTSQVLGCVRMSIQTGTECIPVPPTTHSFDETHPMTQYRSFLCETNDNYTGVERIIRDIDRVHRLIEQGQELHGLIALMWSHHTSYVRLVTGLRRIQIKLASYHHVGGAPMQDFLDQIRCEVHLQWTYPISPSLLDNITTNDTRIPTDVFDFRGCWVIDHPVQITDSAEIVPCGVPRTLPQVCWSSLVTSRYIHVNHDMAIHIDTTNAIPVHLFVSENVALSVACTSEAADMLLAGIALARGATICIHPGSVSTCIRFYRLDCVISDIRLDPYTFIGPSVLSSASGDAFTSDVHLQFCTLHKKLSTISDDIAVIEEQSMTSIVGSNDLFAVGQKLQGVAQSLTDRKAEYIVCLESIHQQFGKHLTDHTTDGSFRHLVSTEGTWLYI